MKTVVDLLLLAILIICAWSGYKKGIIMGVGGVIVIIVALYGANLLSNTFSYEVIPALRPFVSGYMESKAPKILYEQLGYEADEEGNYNVTISVEDLLVQHPEKERNLCVTAYESLGIYTTKAESMADEAIEYKQQNDSSTVSSIIEVLLDELTYFLGFLLAFMLIAILLTVLGNILNLSFKIPGLDILNDALGTVIGLFTGFLFCVILVWALGFAGKIIPETTLQETKIASWFLEKDYFSAYKHLLGF